MANKKGLGVTITNRIFYGTQNPDKNMWVGQKVDVTDSAIAAVYEWFMAHMNDAGKPVKEYSITYPSTDFELVMRRKQPKDIKQEEGTCEK